MVSSADIKTKDDGLNWSLLIILNPKVSNKFVLEKSGKREPKSLILIIIIIIIFYTTCEIQEHSCWSKETYNKEKSTRVDRKNLERKSF